MTATLSILISPLFIFKRYYLQALALRVIIRALKKKLVRSAPLCPQGNKGATKSQGSFLNSRLEEANTQKIEFDIRSTGTSLTTRYRPSNTWDNTGNPLDTQSLPAGNISPNNFTTPLDVSAEGAI